MAYWSDFELHSNRQNHAIVILSHFPTYIERPGIANNSIRELIPFC